MLKNYLKIVFRNLLKHKTYSFINISGLALGLACAVLIILWISDEISYDRFYKNAEQIYRINWDFKWNESEGIGPGTPPPLAASLVNEIPEVVSATRIYPAAKMVARYNDRFFNESRIFGADSNFFQFFNYEFVSGDPQSALNQPNSVVLTEETAHKYFGNKSALGKMIIIGEDKGVFKKQYHNLFKVQGVIKTAGLNSHIKFDLLTSISSHPEVEHFDWSWAWMQVVTYIKIQPGVSPNIVESKIPAIVKKRVPSTLERLGFSYDDLKRSGGHWNFVLQPLKDIYLGSGEIGNRLGPAGDKMYVYIFAVIAVFILSLGCINFTNLATAYSAGRAKEIGIRKVLGSKKKMLIIQFLLESFIFSFLALLFAMLFVEVTIPFFNDLAGKTLRFDIFGSPLLLVSMILLTALVGLAAGSYPGFYLSSFKPVQVLKGTISSSSKNYKFRNLLVIFQFVVTIGLISCTLLVKKQMDFIQQANLGFDKEGLIVINNENNLLKNQADAFAAKLRNNSNIINASVSTGVPPNYGFQDYYKIEGKGDQLFDLISYITDDNFLATMDIKLKEGRGFSKDFSDSSSIILNQSAVKYFGLKDPIGKIITYPGTGQYRVIGVMKDFNFSSLHSPIGAFGLFHVSSGAYRIPDSYIVIRATKNNIPQTLKAIETEWKSFVPDAPFEYKFLDESLEEQYLSDQRLGKIFFVFSFLTIFIACVGLFGLVSFSAQQRIKEIGIRKVLGASVISIISLLLKDFLKLILLANLVALPVAWYIMDKWLQNFVYRVNIGIYIFLVTGVIALLVAIITGSYKAVRAALSNPAEILKME